MSGVRVMLAVSAAGALIAGAGLWPGVHGGAANRSGPAPAVPALLALHRAKPARPAAVPRRALRPVPGLVTVPRLVNPRPGAAIHLTFPRTWRPVTLEVGSPVPKPPLRVFCATCPPGTVLEADL